MPLSSQQIDECVARYEREIDRYEKMANLTYEICNEIIKDRLTIRATVQRRTKDPESLRNKIKKYKDKYSNVEDFFEKISDLAGVRITTYRESDRAKVVEEIEATFQKHPLKSEISEVKDKSGEGKHYRATHCQIILPEDYLSGSNSNLKNTTCEIQICSLLAHVFNEIEHDLQYKELNGELSTSERELIDQLGLITKSGDISIEHLLLATENRHKGTHGKFVDAHDFIARMRGDNENFSVNGGLLFSLLNDLHLDNPEKINSKISQCVDVDRIAKEINDKYDSDDKINPIKRNSSDELFLKLLPSLYNEIITHYSPEKRRGRLPRFLQIAQYYKKTLETDK